MKYVLIGLVAIVGVVVLAIIALLINLRMASRRQERRMQERLASVMDPVRAGSSPNQGALMELAANPETRNALYDALKAAGKEQLFPQDYLTPEAFAESVLVSWLAHPNELQKGPDEIELVGKHVVDGGPDAGRVAYYLYKFRVRAPHFAADRGWMAGACGPFPVAAKAPRIIPQALFSELESFDERTPEEHVQQVHQSATKSGAVESLRHELAAAQ